MAHERDVVAVAAEGCDVVPNPLEGLDLIEMPVVAGPVFGSRRLPYANGSFGGDRRVSGESECAEAIVDRDDDGVGLSREPRTPPVPARSEGERTAMKKDDHRRVVRFLRLVDGQMKAILATFDLTVRYRDMRARLRLNA